MIGLVHAMRSNGPLPQVQFSMCLNVIVWPRGTILGLGCSVVPQEVTPNTHKCFFEVLNKWSWTEKFSVTARSADEPMNLGVWGVTGHTLWTSGRNGTVLLTRYRDTSSLGSTRLISMMGFLSLLKPVSEISLGLGLSIRGSPDSVASASKSQLNWPRESLSTYFSLDNSLLFDQTSGSSEGQN
jgi:hypothetical protein